MPSPENHWLEKTYYVFERKTGETCSRKGSIREHTTDRPQQTASSKGKPNPSLSEGKTKTEQLSTSCRNFSLPNTLLLVNYFERDAGYHDKTMRAFSKSLFSMGSVDSNSCVPPPVNTNSASIPSSNSDLKASNKTLCPFVAIALAGKIKRNGLIPVGVSILSISASTAQDDF